MMGCTTTWRQELTRLAIALGLVGLTIGGFYPLTRTELPYDSIVRGIGQVGELGTIALSAVWLIFGNGCLTLRLLPLMTLILYQLSSSFGESIVTTYAAFVIAGLMTERAIFAVVRRWKGRNKDAGQFTVKQLLDFVTFSGIFAAFSNFLYAKCAMEYDGYLRPEPYFVPKLCGILACAALMGAWMGLGSLARWRLCIGAVASICLAFVLGWIFLKIDFIPAAKLVKMAFLCWLLCAFVAGGIFSYRWLSRKRLVERWIVRDAGPEATVQNGSGD